jgi:ATP phosphoribosyltransferase
MSDPLLVSVPSKGRLQENAFGFFAQAGLPVVRPGGAREYRGAFAGLEGAQIQFLSASEIARELSLGNVHLGVTGEDLIREEVPHTDERVLLLTPLGFGPANVVVAVPQAWIDVRTMADLDDIAAHFRRKYGRPLRVATKYITLTRSFFALHGLGDYRIVESLGATEGAPASGTADVIVDITTTGSTLAANALKILDDGLILKSEANLVASLRADWNPVAREAARAILSRLGAAARARAVQEVKAAPNGDRARIVKEAAKNFGASAPFGIATDGPLTLHVPKKAIYAIADWLMTQGADTISTTDLDDVFQSENPLHEKLLAALKT